MPGSRSSVQVERWLSGTAAKPGHSSWNLDGNTLQLSVDCSGLVFNCGARFQVAVPAGVSVVVHAVSDSVTASGLTGSLAVNDESGSVQVSKMSGPLQLTTTSGAIAGTSIRSSIVHATADQGSVTVTFAAAPAFADVSSQTGNATASVPTAAGEQYQVTVNSGTGATHAKVPDGHGSRNVVEVSSRQGNASVLPAQ